VILLAISMAGFIWQLGDVAQVYFEYRTIVHVLVSFPYKVPAPDVSLCVRYVDIFKGEYNVSVASSTQNGTHFEDKLFRQLQHTVTLKQIFAETPSIDNFMAMCLIREPGNYRLFRLNETQCEARMRISKYYVQEYMCYHWTLLHTIEDYSDFVSFDRYTQRDEVFYKYQNLVFPKTYPALFFAIMVNKEKMEGADMCKVIVHNSNRLPVNTIAYAPNFFRRVSGEDKYNHIGVGYSITRIRKLPPPYNTKCRFYHEFEWERRRCLTVCIQNMTVKVFNKIPFFVLEENNLDIKHISPIDIENDTFIAHLEKMEADCYSKCRQEQCLREYYATSLQKHESGEFDFFSILVNAPQSPIVEVTNREVWTIEDFFVYASTIISIWFGVSILSLNPSNIKNWWNQNKSRIQVKNKKRHTCPCRRCDNKFHSQLNRVEGLKPLLI